MSATLEPPQTLADEKRPHQKRSINLVSIARPYFGLIVLTTILLTVAGIAAMFRMPSGIYPEVAFPRIIVIAQSPGLGVRDVEVAVTRPIEENVSIVLGVVRVRSKSVRGAAEVNIDFAPETDMVQALNDVRARMSQVGSQLPVGTTTLTERLTPSVFPIISFVVSGGKDPSALHDYAYYDLKPRISRIPDVSYVTVQGGDIREVIVEVDPQALMSANLALSDVADRLTKEHRLKAVGRLDRESMQFQVLTDTLAVDPLDIENIVIADKNGQPLRLGDLGKVSIGHEDRTNAIRSNGKDAVSLTVFRRLGGNALAVSSTLQSVLADAAKNAPTGITITPVYDQGQLVRTSIANVRDAIVIGGFMSVLILLMFLKSVRATLIAALSIPLSLIITFVFLYLMGDTLNLMSLGGLAIAIGLIIDDTVVVIENISRHLADGETGDVAIESASREISGAVIGSTFTTILVFVPLAFVRGVIGQFFQSLSLALSVSMLVSMVVSLTIIPVLAARFLAKTHMPTTGPIYNVLAGSYEGLLRLGLKAPLLTLVVSLFAVVPLYFLATNLETDLMPNMDEGAFVLDYHMPVGTSLEQTDKVMRRVENVLQNTKAVSGYIRRTGAELGFFATESYTGDILVSLKPADERASMADVFKEVEDAVHKAVPELEIELVPLIKDQINDLQGVSKEIEILVFGPDPAKIRVLAEQIGKLVEEVDGPDGVNSNVLLGNPDVVVRPDSIKTSRVGLTVLDVENQLNAALYGQVAGSIPEQDRLTKIRVRYPDRIRYDRAHLGLLPINLTSAGGAPAASTAPATTGVGFVPLNQIASIREMRSPNQLTRENQQPVITVEAEKKPGYFLGSVNDKIAAKLSTIKLAPGYRYEIAGTFRVQQESFFSLTMVIIVASALVFLLLGFQFKSLTLPILIFLVQPISLTCALFALYITHTPLNVSSFMGV